MREGTVADPRHPGVRPDRFVGPARESDDVQWQRHLANDALDLLRVRQPRNEEAARAGVGEGPAALDDLINQSIVIGLGL